MRDGVNLQQFLNLSDQDLEDLTIALNNPKGSEDLLQFYAQHDKTHFLVILAGINSTKLLIILRLEHSECLKHH